MKRKKINVLSRAKLRLFWEKHPDSKDSLSLWFTRARNSGWQKLIDVQKDYPDAEKVGSVTVFNIKGNHYRLIVQMEYKHKEFFIKEVLTHAEYDKERWKK